LHPTPERKRPRAGPTPAGGRAQRRAHLRGGQAELLYGARRSARVSDNLRLLARFFATLISLPFDDRCAEEYGFIRADLEHAGTPIGPNDLMLAATARAHDLVLVTHNTREFSRVSGLQIEDWETS
jgi:tRNA(fMet)-specific endonuclease VapC